MENISHFKFFVPIEFTVLTPFYQRKISVILTMAYNEKLADRLRITLESKRGVKEKKMFGGLSFMLKDKMFVGIVKDELMVRMIPDRYEEALEKRGARPMDFTGKIMKGFVFVDSTGFKSEKQLNEWIGMGLEFVNKSKKSTVRKKK
jgi:TfoX/Sxy family transcriptional regulator of competence genes